MRSFRNPLVRSFWLLAYLTIAPWTAGHAVVCVQEDGRMSLEAGECPCRQDHARPPELPDLEAPYAGDSCRDIALLTDAHLASYGRPSVPPAPGPAEHARVPRGLFQYDPSAASPPVSPPPMSFSSVHLSIRSTVLLI